MFGKNKKLDDWDDFEDFSMFNEGDGEGGYKSTTKKGKAREAVGLLTGGFVSGVKKSLFTRNFYQNVVNKSLPKEYSTALDKSFEVKDSIGDLYDTAHRESSNVNDTLTKGVKPIVDKYGDKLPKRMARPLRDWTRNVRSSGEWTKENKDELESVAALNDIFNKREQTRSMKSSSIEAKVQSGLAQNTMSLTAQMLLNQNRMISYQDQFDATWKRKTLELQYKQFFVQRKLLDVQQQSLSYNKVTLAEIMRNTSLPDLVKAKGSEVGSRMITEKLYGAAIDQFSGLPYGILKTMTNNVTKKMESGSRDLRSDLSSGLESLFDMAESSSDASDMMGERESTRAAGETGGGMIANLLASRYGKKFKKKYGENEKVQQGADMLSSGMRRIPRMFNGMMQSGDSGNLLIDMLLELTDARQAIATSTGTVMKNQESELSSQVYFDLLTKKSITEIIPGFLTRIHHEIRSLRTGESRHPMLAYDHNKGVFSNDDAITQKLKDKTIGSQQKQALGMVHDELSKSLGLDKIKDEDLRYQILKQFSLASINNTDFSFSTMLSGDNNSIDADQKDELRAFLESEYQMTVEETESDTPFTERLKAGLHNQGGINSKGAKAQRQIMDSMDKLQSYLVNPTGTLNRMAQRGQVSNAMAIGIVDEKNGVYTLNKERFIEALMSGDITVTDSSGDFEPEEKKDTATKKYFNAKGEEIKKKWEDLSTSERAQQARARAAESRKKASDLVTGAKDNVTSKIDEIREEIDEKGVKKTVTDHVPTAPEQAIIDEFLNNYSNGRYDKLKKRFTKSDRYKRAIEIVKEKYKTKRPSLSNLKDAYATSKEFRDIMNELQEIEKEIDESRSKDESVDKTSDTIRDNFTRTKSSIREKLRPKSNKRSNANNTDIPEATEEDYDDAENYADDFIEKNNIPDPDGEVKDSMIREFFTKRFGDGRVHDAFVKSSKYVGGAKARGKRAINNVRSKGSNGAAGDAIGILFQLSQWSAKAAEIGTRPARAALKLVPWGLRKLTNLVIDTVNFKHVEHGLWLEGEKEPRLLKTGLMAGRYINGKGDIVESPKDLTGDIFDAMSTPEKLIMSESEYKGGLFDSTGKLIYKPPTIAGRITSGLVKLPFKLMKGAAKLAGKFAIGYLKVTTKPVTWLINKIMSEKRIDPKLHAELAQLGLTDQTNQKLDNMTNLINERFPEEKENKFNDKDGDGSRDGNADDTREKHAERKEKEKEKKQGLLSRIFNRKKKKDDDDEDEDGFSLMNILGKGKMFGKLAGLAKNPYVLGGAAIASMIGWEGLTDAGKNKDPEDVANMLLPDAMKDSKMARIGARISEKLVNLVIAPIKGQAKGIVKAVEYASRFSKWVNRKDGKIKDSTKTLLSKIPGIGAKFLFGRQAGRALDKLMNIDNINPLFRFRMAQYGFKHTDTEGVQAILKLEDDILKDLLVATETAPARISDAVTIEQSASYFGVSINDEDDLTEWVAWFANRFRPVFLSNVTVMQRMKYDSKQLHNVDSLMGKADKTAFIKKVDFVRGNFNPYDKSINPMGTEWSLDVVGQGPLDNIKDDSLAEIAAMPDDPVKLKDQKERVTKRENKLTKSAKTKHENTVAEKRFDPYAAIDKINFKSMLGLTAKDKSINDVIADKDKPGFGGGGAGASFEEKARQARIDEHGAVGEMFRGIGGLFMKKAEAAPFFPEAGANGVANGQLMGRMNAGGTFKINAADGVSSLSPADKPMAVARNLRLLARPDGIGAATVHVKKALIASGYKFTAPANAAEYPAKALPDMGFVKINNDSTWMIGDIMVFSSNKTHKNGHIQIYDGANWISDHVQQNWIPMKDDIPTFTIWRDLTFSTKGKFATNKTKDATATDTNAQANVMSKNAVTSKVKPEKDSSSLVQKALDKIDQLTTGAKDMLSNLKNSSPVQAASSFFSGAGDAVSNTLARMTGSQKEWQMSVYKAFKTAGFSEQQSRILTAEIGRENSYNPKYLFAGHADPHKGSNLGMLSWQGSRKPTLIQHLRAAGVLDGSNNMVPGQAALDAQAKFIMWEMKNTHKSVGAVFLSKPNIPYPEGAYLIGKKYILWRIDDPKYGPGGKKNRDGFYNMLLKQLAGGGTAAAVNSSLTKTFAPIVNPLNKMADKIVGAFGGSPTADKKTKSTDGVAAGTDGGGSGAVKIPGNAKPAIAARYCRSNALSGSAGKCAAYVRAGFQKAGYVFQTQASAYQYHTNGTMLTMGFVQISGGAVRQVGDVIILNRNLGAGKPHGHIAIWDGANWVSDFVQRSWTPYTAKIYPWSMWRDKNHLNGASAASGWTPGNVPPNSTASNVVLSGGTDTYGSGASNTSIPFNPVTMKHNDYGDLDSKIKKSYYGDEIPTKKKDAPASTTDKVAVKEINDKNAQNKKALSTIEKAEVKTAEATKAVAKAIEAKSNSSKVIPKDVTSTNTREEVQAKRIEEQVSKNLTQQMKETETRNTVENSSESNKTLRESLKVQKDMLVRLTSMDKHLANVLKGQATRNVSESSNVEATTSKPNSRPNRQQDNKVARPGRDEPMSMSKMI